MTHTDPAQYQLNLPGIAPPSSGLFLDLVIGELDVMVYLLGMVLETGSMDDDQSCEARQDNLYWVHWDHACRVLKRVRAARARLGAQADPRA